MGASRGGWVVAVLGLIGLAGLVIWYGILTPRGAVEQAPASPPQVSSNIGTPAPQNKAGAEPAPGPPAAPPPPAEAKVADPAPVPSAPLPPTLQPSFDVVRVEPTGDSVIAGRGAPGATIDMLRNGEPHARVIADAGGLFAIVPPPLPPGSSEIILQSIAPDGTRTRSRDSVTVEVAADRKTPPLVALTSPDRPTVILSGQEPNQAVAAAPPPAPALPNPPAPKDGSAPAPAPSGSTLAPEAPAPAPPAPRTEARIASVETQSGGRFFVSGQAAPGATVRLYLNDSLIAPGAVAPDGRFSFAIEKGVRPGHYAVRIDDVDPVSGQVKSRAEVEFVVPEATAERIPMPVPAPAAPPAAIAAAAPPPILSQIVPPPLPPAAVVVSPPAAPGDVAALASTAPPLAVAGLGADQSKPGSTGAAGSKSAIDANTVIVPEVSTALVARGDNLWRISRRVYGQGIRYTVIYGANQPQIRNPSLIYPGQVFVLPPEQVQKN